MPAGMISRSNRLNLGTVTAEYLRRFLAEAGQAGVNQYLQGSPVNLLQLLIGNSLIWVRN